ncbi:hypothetical protein D9M69_706110 [compost metagenome]
MGGVGRQHDGVAVGLGARHQIGGDLAGRAGAVLDDHGLPQGGLQAFADQSGDDIAGAARAECRDHFHRLGWIIRRLRRPGQIQREQRGRACRLE